MARGAIRLWRRLTGAGGTAAPPSAIDLLRRQADLHGAAGDAAGEEAAWSAVLGLDGEHAVAHGRLAKIRLQQGRLAEAAIHLEVLTSLEPGDAAAWRRLARCRLKTGDIAGETAALRRILEIEPDDVATLDRMAAIALDAGEPREAARLLRALAEACPDDPEHWRALADCLRRLDEPQAEAFALDRSLSALREPDNKGMAFALGAARRLTRLHHELAAPAWERIITWRSWSTEARAQLEEIKLYGPGHGPALLRGARQRVLVVGNCQAYGLGRQLRVLCPSAEVRTIGLAEAASPEDADALLGRWAAIDVVVTQHVEAPRFGELVSARLERRAGRLLHFPNIHFRGFHPDKSRFARDPLNPIPNRGFHSAIIRAAHVLGVPERQVADLFNAYLYGVLGYFEEHAKSELWHIGEARRLGIDLEPLLAQWRSQGVWLHMPNHPIAAVFRSMALKTAADLGLETAVEAAEPFDELQSLGVWPVYPEIAARLGLQGALRFEPGPHAPPLDLDEFIAHSYRTYAGLDAQQVVRGVEDAVEVLRAEGV